MSRPGRRAESREPERTGVLVVDKPRGMTSHDVVDAVRRAAGQRKVGHTGTLDPDATGVLVVCLGRATRLARFLQEGTKTYVAGVRFGVETDTQDATGKVLASRSAAGLDEAALRSALVAFVGEVEQIPPMVSAVKVGGERLYKKARRGEDVERSARRVTVHRLDLDDFAPGEEATARLTVACSSGTYVRTLAHDLGRELGCGAHLTELRRTENSGFTLADAHPLEAIRMDGQEGRLDARILPLREVVRRGLPIVEIPPQDARAAATGGALPPAGFDGPYAAVSGEHVLGVYRDREGQGRAEVVLVRPEELT